METEELTKLVDGIYKNILDKFNPGARQLINAGKAYLKALNGAAAASRIYVDALSKLALQAQLGAWGGSQDVGSALMRIVEVYKEIQEQEMNILKAFYVDLLVPLETNLEKDTKVVQSEQKKFLQQHKTRSETYSKAAATMKKQRKKSRGASKSGLAMDKELKNMQILEEEKSKLDAFCEQSLKNAMTQERRRYGFVLERQCSLAKHYASFHEVALAALHPSVDEWREVAGTREYLPQSVEDMFASRLRQVSFWPEDEENCGSELTMSSQLRKTRSMDSSCLELRLGPPPPPGHPPTMLHHSVNNHLAPALSRAKSEANIHASSLSLGPEVPETPPRPRSMAPASRSSMSGGVGTVGGGSTVGIGVGGGGSSTGTGVSSSGWGDSPLARALFAYLSSGENQLSFLEGDLIALMGDRQKGWQFGENLRTQGSGWFPLAYTEIIVDDNLGSPSHVNNGRSPEPRVVPPCKPPPSRPPVTPSIDELSLVHGGHHHSGNNNTTSINPSNGTPINVPKSNSSHSIATPTGRQPKSIRSSGTLPTMLAGGRRVQPPVPPVPPPQAVTSLHSSNDSGFSNEPPVQPDIDYSDDEAMRQRRRKTRMDRAEAADRGKQQHQQQQQQQQRQSREDEKNSGPKQWDNNNDSWKTIPRDDKNWHSYRNAMDIWDTSNSENERSESVTATKYSNGVRPRRGGQNEESKDASRKDYTNNQRAVSSDRENSTREKRSKKSENRKNDYDSPPRNGGRSEPERSGRYANGGEETSRRKRDDDRRDKPKQSREIDESEDDETMTRNDDIMDDDDDNYGMSVEYKDDYEAKKYYEGNNDEVHRYGQQKENNARENADKYADDNKSESETTSTDSEDASTITIPETGRKVEHIAQKLEQTAQKYAREHSPPKYVERRRVNANETTAYKQDNNNHHQHHHHNQQESKVNVERDDKPPPSYERAYENEGRSRNSQRFDRGYQASNDSNAINANKQQSRSNNSGTTIMANSHNGTYERTSSFAKNPERKRNSMDRDGSSRRRFDNRPRPPFEDAPERPEPRSSGVKASGNVGGYRERRYSEKEEIYGETGVYPRELSTLDKDRGYESNFETKLERTKILEKVQLIGHRGRNDDSSPTGSRNRNSIAISDANRSARNNEINDTNNNTLKNERKNMLLPRQATTLGHMAQTGRTFDLEAKSPKLVKRTKSFWRFRRDSDVLEGMALWQHRSLVDIPKMLKREASDDERNKNETMMMTMGRKTASPEGSQGSGKSIGKESRSSDNTITNDEDKRSNPRNRDHERYQNEREERNDEPKPAERMHVPDKSDYYESDFPTPAERPKLTERSDYRMQREERSLFVGNVSRKAIIEKERKRSMEAKRNMVVAELKENNEAAAAKVDTNRRNKSYGDDEDGLIQGFSETEASDEESTYSCIIVKDQAVTEKTLLPRTKLRRDSDREREKNTCGPWYDLWGVDNSVTKKKNK